MTFDKFRRSTFFIDAGTVTADFNRWSKDSKSSLIATFAHFLANSDDRVMLVGGVMTAAFAVPTPNRSALTTCLAIW
jgi:cytosine permease